MKYKTLVIVESNLNMIVDYVKDVMVKAGFKLTEIYRPHRPRVYLTFEKELGSEENIRLTGGLYGAGLRRDGKAPDSDKGRGRRSGDKSGGKYKPRKIAYRSPRT